MIDKKEQDRNMKSKRGWGGGRRDQRSSQSGELKPRIRRKERQKTGFRGC
jgi:hypothetical protein